MKVVNLGDPYKRRITLRLTDVQYEYLLRVSEQFETSPSNYIRYLIDKSFIDYDRDYLGEIIGGTSNENVKTSCDDNL